MLRPLIPALGTGVIAGSIVSFVLPLAIWPGEARLTAPLFCRAPYLDPMVVSDTFHDSEGTSVNYTLYCVSERGALTDEGFILPFLTLFAVHIVLVTALVLVALLWTRKPSDSPVESGAVEL
ncbi:hypothetical protein [Nocardia cerradoensis]|uniref:Uncharacterized protein n=1 Tax=Nocardia cerradoensis TaxID=85688 RepID=A0A231H179_9NOCA|nr:hypothetical protein [Nocardia cerradoensis]NKY43133.1 hypothetical protein [Nocardia cerradoensis]OXR42613.1 hypothetical protein B7C42_05391 [Nocardia cerradoensis]